MLFQALFLPSQSPGPVSTGPFDSRDPLVIYSVALNALLKILFMIGAGLYVVFAFVVVRQIHIMKATVVTPFSGVIQLLGYLHLLLAVGVVVYFFVLL